MIFSTILKLYTDSIVIIIARLNYVNNKTIPVIIFVKNSVTMFCVLRIYYLLIFLISRYLLWGKKKSL